MKEKLPSQEEMPLEIVGSSVFGKYPKISAERTYNMYVSDDWLVSFPGYIKKIDLKNVLGSGYSSLPRGVYVSSLKNIALMVIDKYVYVFNEDWTYEYINKIDTSTGDVYIAENLNDKIVIVDGVTNKMWIYDYWLNTFKTQNLSFIPSNIAYQDTYYLAASKDRSEWWIGVDNADPSGEIEWKYMAKIQTDVDVAQAVVPLPGKSGQILVIGKNVTESWVDVGNVDNPYQKNTGYSIDYGCISLSTIARGDNIVAWVGVNKTSGLAIMYSIGAEAMQISTDGISYQLSNLTAPEQAYGFIYKIDGHLFYHLSFVNPSDNFSLIYDFNTQKFYDLTDKTGTNAHIAKKVFTFGDKTYFITHEDSCVYEMSSNYTSFDGDIIPRTRIPKHIRNRETCGFIVDEITFPVEQGMNAYPSYIDLYTSGDGGNTFGNPLRYTMNERGNTQGKAQWTRLGLYLDFVPAFTFSSLDRILATNGSVLVST